jgi:hypothetical protein
VRADQLAREDPAKLVALEKNAVRIGQTWLRQALADMGVEVMRRR